MAMAVLCTFVYAILAITIDVGAPEGELALATPVLADQPPPVPPTITAPRQRREVPADSLSPRPLVGKPERQAVRKGSPIAVPDPNDAGDPATEMGGDTRGTGDITAPSGTVATLSGPETGRAPSGDGIASTGSAAPPAAPPPPPDPPKPPKPVEPPKARPPVSGGVLNGTAKNLVVPRPISGVKGEVTVEVTISEEGKVTEARAISGHPRARASAVTAALKSTFIPTRLSNKPVKVTGVIRYLF